MHFNFNILWKTMVTHAPNSDISRLEESAMAKQMNHSLDTADKIYDVGTKMNITHNFRTILNRVIQDLPTENDILPQNEEEISEPQNEEDISKPPSDEEPQKTLIEDKKGTCKWLPKVKDILKKQSDHG